MSGNGYILEPKTSTTTTTTKQMSQTQNNMTATGMTKIPYLHPKDRVLRSGQVGLSGHRNTYNMGVLDANYVEDRVLNEERPTARTEFLTTNQYFHNEKTTIDNIVPNKNTEQKLTHPRETEVNHFVSMNTMTYGSGIKPDQTYNLHKSRFQHQPVLETLKVKPSLSSTPKVIQSKPAPNEFIEKYNSPSSPCTETTYRALMKGDGEPVKQRSSKIWGQSTSSINADYLKMDLRGNYPLKHTPLNKTNNQGI